MSVQRPVTLTDIRDAHKRIAGRVTRTPLRLSPYLSEYAGHPVKLKLETMQDTGAFKLRGATNALLNLSDESKSRGVIAVSTGNHGRGVAFAAKALGIKCAVYMSELVPEVKVDAIRKLGAEVIIAGRSQDDAESAAFEVQALDVGAVLRAHAEPEAAFLVFGRPLPSEQLDPALPIEVGPAMGDALVAQMRDEFERFYELTGHGALEPIALFFRCSAVDTKKSASCRRTEN